MRAGLQLTPEARQQITAADEVFYQVGEPIAAAVIEDLNPHATSLETLYGTTKRRADTYHEMVELILDSVRAGKRVCAAFYGHPGVVVAPGHQAVRRARAEGYEAVMLPGVSAEDCLFADLGVNPGDQGLQTYKANDFLVRPRTIDIHTPLVLWQPVVVGETKAVSKPNYRGIKVLSELLADLYGPEHEVVLYVAAIYPVGEPTIEYVTIGELASADISMRATLYVPPAGDPTVDPEIATRLGLSEPGDDSISVSAAG